MSGGTLDADETLTVSGALTQGGAITDRRKATGKTLTYSGASLSLGANTLTLSGGGTLSNTNAFALNHARQQAPAELNYSCQSKHICTGNSGS